jgi:replicative DNA helicase
MIHPELPQDIEAERAVLGSILLNREALPAIADSLDASMFHYERHSQIYSAMLHLYQQRTPPDTRTVAGELKRRGQLETCGGVGYLSELVDAVPSSYHVQHYARLVEEAWLARRVITLGGKVASLGYDWQQGGDMLRAEVQALVTEVIAQRAKRDAVPLGDLMNSLWDQFGKSEMGAISTGLHDLDELIYGVRKTRLITIAGRPSHGKTALALSIACNVSRPGHAGLIFSMEMDGIELAQRILSMQSGIDGKQVQQFDLSDDELRHAAEWIGRVGDWPLFIRVGAVTLNDIRTMTLRHIAQHGPLAFVVVDYVGLVTPSGRKGQNRVQEIGEISRGLKALAMEAQCDVFMLAQLNREIEHRTDPIPTLADLRDSGDIEQDSNIVIFVVNPERFDPQTEHKGMGFLYVAKHRGGPCGKVALRFNAPLTRFDNLERYRGVEGYE